MAGCLGDISSRRGRQVAGGTSEHADRIRAAVMAPRSQDGSMRKETSSRTTSFVAEHLRESVKDGKRLARAVQIFLDDRV